MALPDMLTDHVFIFILCAFTFELGNKPTHNSISRSDTNPHTGGQTRLYTHTDAIAFNAMLQCYSAFAHITAKLVSFKKAIFKKKKESIYFY